MIAAIYARRSTEQTGADADAKSVDRQVENARAFAATKGWTIREAHVYTDDAVSGAETKRLVNRQRLLDAIRTGPPFQALIMRDASRFSRRDGDEAFGELKAIAKAGVDIWFYQDQQRFTFGTFGDNIVGFVRAEDERRISALNREVDDRGDGAEGEGGTRHRRQGVRLRPREGRRAHRAPYQRIARRGHPPHLRAVRIGHRLHAHRQAVERRARRGPATATSASRWLESLHGQRGPAPIALSRRGGLEQDKEARCRRQDRPHRSPGSRVDAVRSPGPAHRVGRGVARGARAPRRDSDAARDSAGRSSRGAPARHGLEIPALRVRALRAVRRQSGRRQPNAGEAGPSVLLWLSRPREARRDRL